MTTIVEYQCDLCRQKYDHAAQALACENRGIADPSAYPIGWVFEYHHNGFVGIFCIAKVVPSDRDIHSLRISHWAIRMPGFPKYSLNEDLCGGSSYNRTDQESVNQFIKHHYVTNEKTEIHEFKEMIEYLNGRGISPFYYTPQGIKITL